MGSKLDTVLKVWPKLFEEQLVLQFHKFTKELRTHFGVLGNNCRE